MPRRAVKVDCVCRGCGVAFQLNPGQVARGRGQFCSAACYQKARAAEWVEIVCTHCGRKVSVRRLYVDRGQYKYCSNECRLNLLSTPVERQRICASCGREFTISPMQGKR